MSTIERVLITGVNQGIGLGIVREYLERGDARIFATCREPGKAAELDKLAAEHPDRVIVVPLEME